MDIRTRSEFPQYQRISATARSCATTFFYPWGWLYAIGTCRRGGGGDDAGGGQSAEPRGGGERDQGGGARRDGGGRQGGRSQGGEGGPSAWAGTCEQRAGMPDSECGASMRSFKGRACGVGPKAGLSSVWLGGIREERARWGRSSAVMSRPVFTLSPLHVLCRLVRQKLVYERRQRDIHHRVDIVPSAFLCRKKGRVVRKPSELPQVSDVSVLCTEAGVWLTRG